MAANIELGKLGEELATACLVKEGYRLLHRNWRSAHQEIDLIAEKDKTVHFIEVKLRTSRKFGAPEVSVNRKKFANLKLAAEQFLLKYKGYRFVQFDVLSITKVEGEAAEYFWIRDIWY